MQLHEVERPPLPVPTGEKQVWTLLHGPCWCRGAPDASASFDLSRYRTDDLGAFDRHLIVVSQRVVDGSLSTVRRLCAETPDPKLIISVATCPAADPFWDQMAGGWTPVTELIPVDIAVDACIAGHPEALLAAVLRHLTADTEVPPPLESSAGLKG